VRAVWHKGVKGYGGNFIFFIILMDLEPVTRL
jgi:hypothetical protein